MEIVSSKEEMVFRNDYNGKAMYSIGLSKKKQDGSYEKGYMNVSFKKDVELQSQTKIIIKQAWLDFYKKDKATIPYIFINDFIIVEDKQENKINPKEIKYTDKDLSMFDSEEIGENIEIPF